MKITPEMVEAAYEAICLADGFDPSGLNSQAKAGLSVAVAEKARYLRYASAAAAALAQAVPEGWKLVPCEPTEKMLRSAFAAMNETPSGTWKRMKAEGVTPRRMFDVKMAPRYRAMLAAAPEPEEMGDSGGGDG